MSRIALDYDGTYTADPELWQEFVRYARSRGHEVYVVTMRYPHECEDVERQLSGKVSGIIYTGRKGKLRHTSFMDKPIDIWIDDMPHFILEDAAP